MSSAKRRKNEMRCPYCGSTVIYRSAEGIYRENSSGVMLYVCARYPKCDAYVRVHAGTKKPVGTMANRELRELRNKAHRTFDQIHKSGIMTREEAYMWLSNMLSLPLSQTHIGNFGEYYCEVVLKESQKLLEKAKENS